MTEPSNQVRLLSNVPLSNSYEHQLTFSDISHQVAYFNSKVTEGMIFDDFTFVREHNAIKVPMPHTQVRQCNYMMYKNLDYSTKWFYAFITRTEYINPNCTKVYFEIDVFQTWQHYLTYKESFVEREHTKRFNLDGSPVVNTNDEGLDYGSEYLITHVDHIQAYETIYFLVMVSKGMLHGPIEKKANPMINGAPQPLSYYIHPFKLGGAGVPNATVGGTPSNLSSIEMMLKTVSRNDATVNNIVSMYITEYIGYNATYNSSTDTLTFDGATFLNAAIPDTSEDGLPTVNTIYVQSIPTYNTIIKNTGNKYNGFYSSTESKLYMHPYCTTILTDLKGNQVEIKNEYIQDSDLSISIKGSLGNNNKISYQPVNYRMNQAAVPYGSQVSIESGLINQNPNDVPIITDLLAAYLQGNRNTLENQKNQILFNAFMGTATGLASGAIQGGTMAGTGGAIAGAAQGAVNPLANAYFQLQGINAKKQDIIAQPPNLNKMGSNTHFDYGNSIHGLYIIKKQITFEYKQKLEKYFKHYGYKVNTFKVPDIKSRKHFNFIKTIGCNLTGNIPMEDLNKIKAIFNNGITFWHTEWIPDTPTMQTDLVDVGNYSFSNEEV